MPQHPTLIALICSSLIGCTQFPELEGVVSPEAARADYPALVPVERIYATLPPPAIEEDTARGLEDRAAALKARAQRLGGAVIDGQTRARMQAGVPAI